ncbi:MAG: methyltransferase domain-containing protein [Oscillatoria princeps RMCB-10]|jgi:SAM-dependent methyltransferase|nr:methyltransferase domain-containing protein [Oscillatoria princeps RMCB-10]
MEHSETVREQFDRAAAAYAASPIFAKGHDLALMVQTGSPAPDMTVLDVGCGAGHTAFAFAPHVREVTGIDLSPGMRAVATQQAAARGIANVRFQEAGATQLPFADSQFDIVTCRYVAHHFPDLTPALKEIVRVLKPGGQFLVTDIISPDDGALALFIDRIEILRDPSHRHDWTIFEWQAAGESAGMPLAAIAEWKVPVDFADWTARQQTPPAAVAKLEALLDSAPPAAQSAFSIVSSPARSFQLWSALLRGFKPNNL